MITDATYVDETGTVRDNPLNAGVRPGGGPATMNPGLVLSTATLQAQVNMALGASNFETHSNAIESGHNTVHGQTGGGHGICIVLSVRAHILVPSLLCGQVLAALFNFH